MITLLVVILLPDYISSYNTEQPYAAGKSVVEQASPSDWIDESQIKVYKNRVIIDVKDAEWAAFTDTNSMDPVIDKGANAIEIVPKDHKDIKAGDIISYEIDEVNGTIIHRIIKTGFDDNGWYAITKGDNVKSADPYKIRFENIKRVVIAIIY